MLPVVRKGQWHFLVVSSGASGPRWRCRRRSRLSMSAGVSHLRGRQYPIGVVDHRPGTPAHRANTVSYRRCPGDAGRLVARLGCVAGPAAKYGVRNGSMAALPRDRCFRARDLCSELGHVGVELLKAEGVKRQDGQPGRWPARVVVIVWHVNLAFSSSAGHPRPRSSPSPLTISPRYTPIQKHIFPRQETLSSPLGVSRCPRARNTLP